MGHLAGSTIQHPRSAVVSAPSAQIAVPSVPSVPSATGAGLQGLHQHHKQTLLAASTTMEQDSRKQRDFIAIKNTNLYKPTF